MGKKTPSKHKTGVLNCISSNSLWELDSWYSNAPAKGREVIHPGVSAGLQKRPRAPLILSIFSTLIFYSDPSRTAADISAPSDRLDGFELIGLMIFLPHFPPLYGCSMVHGADGWKQLPHTHTHVPYLTITVSTSRTHTRLGGRYTQTFAYSLSFPAALAHESPFRCSSGSTNVRH